MDRRALSLVALLPLAAACGGKPAATTGQGAAVFTGKLGTATLSGRILFQGRPPAPEKIAVTADPACAAQHKDGLLRQPVLVKDGGLANVVVHVRNAAGTYRPPTEAVELVQRGCEYFPHVIALQAGQPLRVVNDDDTLHNVHPRPSLNEEWNLGQPERGASNTKTFDRPEVMFPMGCDVHPWRRAWVSVLPSPFFAVSGEDGRFEIKNLPAGEWEVEAVHETLKSQTQKVTVKEGETARLDFTFQG